jgi:broad specificity phosphatase PhoE
MDIFLVRHGEAAAGWGQSSDPGLSELGLRQAEEVAEALLPRLSADTALLSSPLARARETAIPLAEALEKPVVVEDVFREVPAPVPLPQRQPWLRDFMQQQWPGQPPSLTQWRDRALTELLEQSQPAVVFTHFLLINAVVGRVLRRPEILCFWPDNGSITQLRHSGDTLELVSLGREMETVVN